MKHTTEKPLPHQSSAILACLAILLLMALIVFRCALPSDVVVSMTDNNVGYETDIRQQLPQGFLSYWADSPMLGTEGSMAFTWRLILLWVLPVTVYLSSIHAIDLLFASLFLMLFLREQGRTPFACLAGALIAYWIGTNLTLAYAGHITKFTVLGAAAATLWLVQRAASRRSIAWSIVAGGGVGLMFLEQQDVALFWGLFLGAYALFATIREEGLRLRPLLLRLLPMATTALLIAGPVMTRSYAKQIQGAAIMSDQTDAAEKWNFSTQWSVPPGELLDLVAPGYTGWRSNEPTGPYWGKTGGSPGWERTGKGFRNFRLESVYIGPIGCGLALLAIYLGLQRRRWDGNEEDPQSRGNVIFWAAATLVALLLAFGKYFPLYGALYQLPLISSIRNPNKFLHIFQVGLAVLAAYGWDLSFKPTLKASTRDRSVRVFAWCALAFGLILCLWAGVVRLNNVAQMARFTGEGWGSAAEVMVQNMVSALVQGGLISLVLGVALWFSGTEHFSANRMTRVAVRSGLILVLAIDITLLARHYIQPYPMSAVNSPNAVVKYLKRNADGMRTAMVDPQGFYGLWRGTLFPYHGIATFNPDPNLRMGALERDYLGTLGQNPLRVWELGSVGYLLAPRPVWTQLSSRPETAALFTEELDFNPYSSGGGVSAAPGTDERPGQHVLLAYRAALPRYSLIGQWETVEDSMALGRLADPRFDPHQTVVLSPSTEANLSSGEVSGDPPGTVTVTKTDTRSMSLKVDAGRNTILLVTQRYAPGWTARVDGIDAPVLRCNYLCLGVPIEAGTHDVVLAYRPRGNLLWIQACGTMIWVVALGMAMWRKNPESSS